MRSLIAFALFVITASALEADRYHEGDWGKGVFQRENKVEAPKPVVKSEDNANVWSNPSSSYSEPESTNLPLFDKSRVGVDPTIDKYHPPTGVSFDDDAAATNPFNIADIKCTSQGGLCTTSPCSGTTQAGLCPGSAANRCCFSAPPTPTATPVATQIPRPPTATPTAAPASNDTPVDGGRPNKSIGDQPANTNTNTNTNTNSNTGGVVKGPKGTFPVYKTFSYKDDGNQVVKQVFKAGDAYFWVSDIKVDADGAPNTYSPSDNGIDYNANGGITSSKPAGADAEYGIVYKNGNRCIQGASDPYPGFFVSGTAARSNLDVCDPNNWADSNTNPYFVIPGRNAPALATYNVGVMVNLDTGVAIWSWAGDAGPSGKIGEASISAVASLGRNPFLLRGTLKNRPIAMCGFDSKNILVVQFTNSNSKFLATYADIANAAKPIFDKWGGIPMLESVAGIKGIKFRETAVSGYSIPHKNLKCTSA